MSTATVDHDITHRVQARDDHRDGGGRVSWYVSINGGESYIGPTTEVPEAGDHVSFPWNTVPISLAYPHGFRVLGLTLIGEPEPLAETPA